MRQIIIDTETTGLVPYDGHRIIELCALESIDYALTGRMVHCYVNPERDVPKEAYRIHGISEAFLKDKKVFREIADEFLLFIAESELIIHNAPFDIKFLNHELSFVGKGPIRNKVVDTLLVARSKFPRERVSLDALCRKYKIDRSHRDLHGALKDSELLHKVYINLIEDDLQFKLMFDTHQSKDLHNQKSQNDKKLQFVIHKPNKTELGMHNAMLCKIRGALWKEFST